MNAVYDHIIAILIVGAIFVGTVVVMPTMSLINLQAVDQQQLRNTALNVFNAMLLDTGLGFDGVRWTADWGSIDPFDMGDVKKFGLAIAHDSTFYVLDPDKVQRLVKGNPLGEISYTKVKERLGLQDYGFSLRIIPPFNVTNADGTKIDENHCPINETALSQKKLQYAVKVSYLDGRPISNAAIQAIAVYSNKTDFAITLPYVTTTNAVGIGSDSIPLNFVPWHITAILRVSVADVAALVVTVGKNPIKIIDINMAGDNVILTRPKDAPSAEVKLNGVYFLGGEGTLNYLYNGTNHDHFNTGKGQHRLWNNTFSGLKDYDPVLLIFNIETVPPNAPPGEGGNQEIAVAGPYQNLLGHTVFDYGDSPKRSSSAVRIQRSVIISGMTYTAELWLWKESP